MRTITTWLPVSRAVAKMDTCSYYYYLIRKQVVLNQVMCISLAVLRALLVLVVFPSYRMDSCLGVSFPDK
jgi:hypothetical protein